MQILITGAAGFLGKNLAAQLRNRGYTDLLLYDVDTDPGLLELYARDCGFVFHLAGVNRPRDPAEFQSGNVDFTALLLDSLKARGNKVPVLMVSSIQAALDNPYGNSKRAGEELVFAYGEETGAQVFVYRLPNVFGKWCRPGYNSAVATFCHNLARELPIEVHDPAVEMNLVYIDDVIHEFIRAMKGNATPQGDFYCVQPVHTVQLGQIADILRSFGECRRNLTVPDMSDPLTRKLYSAYLSYLPEDGFAYELTTHADKRGSFTEFLRTPDRGQVAVNVLKPGIVKGNHWHHSKNEKFLVVQGEGMIRFRRMGCEDIHEYRVSGEKLEAVDIPTGYIHSLTNTGNRDMVVIIWANECFDPENPDTYYQEV